MRRPSRKGLLEYCYVLTGHFFFCFRDILTDRSALLTIVVMGCFAEVSPVYSQRDSISRQLEDSVAIERLTEELLDTSRSIRAHALSEIHQLGRSSPDRDFRRRIVDLLADNCVDGRAASTGAILEYLKTYSSDDFGTRSRTQLATLLTDDAYARLPEIIRLCAFLDMREIAPRIETLAGEKYNPAVRWSATLGLVRMGDTRAASTMMRRVKQHVINDNIVYRLLPDLVFTRHPDAIRFLIEIVYSDATDCMSPDPEIDDAIPCAYRVAELLAPVIKGFPVALGPYGDLDTDDYPRALRVIRQWLRQRTNFEMITETY